MRVNGYNHIFIILIEKLLKEISKYINYNFNKNHLN